MANIVQSFTKINEHLALYENIKLENISINTKIKHIHYKLKLELYDDAKKDNITIDIDYDTSSLCKNIQHCGIYDIIIKHSDSNDIVTINEDSNFNDQVKILSRIHKNNHVYIESIKFTKECIYNVCDDLESFIKLEIIFENKQKLEIFLGYEEEYFNDCHHSLPVVTSLMTNTNYFIYSTSI